MVQSYLAALTSQGQCKLGDSLSWSAGEVATRCCLYRMSHSKPKSGCQKQKDNNNNNNNNNNNHDDDNILA